MSRTWLALLSSAVFLATCSHAQMNSEAPDTTYFLPVEEVGSGSGTLVPFYGCKDNGATLLTLGVWANAKWIRGLRASLTDGRQNFFGCLNVDGNQTGQTGCSDDGVSSSNFTFQAGERIVELNIWPGYNAQGQANQRAGALNFTTSLGRSFDFGMTDPRQNGTQVDVGEGIPCGIAPKAGADIDSLGFVFLQNVTASALQNVQYSGVPNSNAGGVSSDVAPLDESAVTLELGDQIFNNTGKTTSLVATSSSQATFTSSSQWSSAQGLDSYLLAPVNASIPQLTDSSNASYIRWQLNTQEVHARNVSQEYQEAWNYTVNVGPNGVSQITGSSLQGNITATYTSVLNVTLDSGASFSVPVSGQFQGLSNSPVAIKVVELAAATQAASSTNGSGKSTTVPWVVGILVGVIVGLLLAALLAWAIVLIMRKRNKRAREQQQANNAQPPDVPKSWPFIPGVFGKGKKSPAEPQKDVELGNPGKSKFFVDDSDSTPAVSPVVGVPVSNTKKGVEKELPPQKGELPESEGRHVLPYTAFRRLRLDSLKKSLAKDEESNTPVGKTAEALKRLEDDELSNPASDASTPRTLPDMASRDYKGGTGSDVGAESIVASEPGYAVDDEKVAVSENSFEDEKQLVPKNDAQKRQLREQVARKMAERRSTPERERAAAPSAAQPPQAAPGQSSSPGHKMPFFKKLSDTITTYRGPTGVPVPHPSGLDKRDVRSDTMQHADTSLKLGQGYKSSKASQKNTLAHDDERLKLGVKYNTRGRNE